MDDDDDGDDDYEDDNDYDDEDEIIYCFVMKLTLESTYN